MKMDIAECAELLKGQDNILIVSHLRPDGDTLGSSAALCHALKRLGKTAWMYPNTEATEKYLPYVTPYYAPCGFEPKYFVAVDTAEMGMTAVGYGGNIDLCIDHHPSNARYAKKLLLGDKKSACGEIILELIKTMCGGIDQTEGTLLYIAISTDTGCFQYSNTNSATFRAAAETLDAGADIHELNQRLFRRVSKARIILEGMIFSGMEFYRDGGVAVATVTLDMLKKAGATENDCDDLANLTGRVEGALVCVTIREMDDGTSKISVRTGPSVNSSDICAVYGGGGHAMAAGCTLNCPPDEARDRILKAIDQIWK
jgi:phosphoesterase RecJ-like protein